MSVPNTAQAPALPRSPARKRAREQAQPTPRTDPGRLAPAHPFEERLASSSQWALSEGSQFFMASGSVQDSLRRITRALDSLGIPYALVGGMALFFHGYRRFTEDVDLLVTREHLQLIHEHLSGRGYLPPFPGSRHLRDTETGVKIEFLVTGDFPGDGRPKPVAFPDPAVDTMDVDGIRIAGLPTLLELKLASGMTGADRQKDLVDVQELIKALSLTEDFALNLSEYVRAKYGELWRASRPTGRTYMLRRSPEISQETARAMEADGLTLETTGGHLTWTTTDPALAEKYGMHPAEDYL